MTSKHSLATLKLLIIIILLGLYYSYFFKTVIKSYGEGLTNLASTKEKFETTKLPTIIICMRPTWKKSVLEKYNISEGFFQLAKGSYEHLIGENTMEDIVLEASFRLNKDFYLGINDMYPDPSPKLDLNNGLNKLQIDGQEYTINVSDVYSVLKGVCFTISSNLPISMTKGYFLSIKLADEMTEKPDKVGLTIVSEEDSLGILFQIWETANIMEEQVVGFETGTTQVNMQEIETTRIVGCNEDAEPWQECLTKNLHDLFLSSNCTDKCTPMGVKSYFDRYIENPLPDCTSLEKENCMFKLIFDIGSQFSQCEPRCITKEYSGRVTFISQEFLGLGHGDKSADMMFNYGSTSRTVVQEYWVYDTEGMIGTLGGSLGLFLGFSFYGFISDLLDLFWKAIVKQD